MYGDFAYIYDELINDVSYAAWADYIEKIFLWLNVQPELILDLGCGTGSFCIEMSKRGYEMIGVDSSPDMLSCARNKSLSCNADILFLNQDIINFELYGTVDAIVCLMDSVNYITDKRDLRKLFKLVKNYLNPGGVLIFDINSPYKFEKILDKNTFYEVNEEVSYIWKNNYSKKNKICEFDLTFFVKEGELFRKFDELHYERCYFPDELEKVIVDTGLELVGIFDDLKMNKPKKNSERIFLVCKKQ